MCRQHSNDNILLQAKANPNRSGVKKRLRFVFDCDLRSIASFIFGGCLVALIIFMIIFTLMRISCKCIHPGHITCFRCFALDFVEVAAVMSGLIVILDWLISYIINGSSTSWHISHSSIKPPIIFQNWFVCSSIEIINFFGANK